MENNNTAHVFISYSRRNIEFAKRLYAELNKNKRDIWVDWEDIPRGTDWLQEIYAGIDRSDTFIFLVSEHSLVSEICNQELSYALKQHKRIIPLILRQIDDPLFAKIDSHWKTTNWYPVAHKNWDALKHLNWVFFDNLDKYDSEFQALLETVDQDLYHIKTHTRLLVRAREWLQREKNTSYLLVGDDILSAEHWIQTYAMKDPLPTLLHRDYIQASRKRENERIAYERRLQNQARNRLQILVASFVLIILAMIFGLLPITGNMLETQLGDETDERLSEAAISFEELMAEDLFTSELSASFVAMTVDPELLLDNDPDAFEEFGQLRAEFELQEVSFYRPDFGWGDDPVFYDGPEVRHNERVQEERERLLLDAIQSRDVRTRLIIGSPESQIAGAIPVFANDENDNWSIQGVVLVAYHITDEYMFGLAEILNVEAVLINEEQEVVASTFDENPPELLDRFRENYSSNFGRELFSGADDAYLDYTNLQGDTLRIIQHSLVIEGDVIGYLFVGRSFAAVINLQNQIANTFFVFSGGILVVIIVLLIVLVGIPAIRNRSASPS